MEALGFEVPEQLTWDFIWEEAVKQNGELEIIAIGPLTNLAIAVMKYPQLPKLVKKLVIMGGAAGSGNFGVYSEYNIAQDPHACEIVLQAGFPDFTMVDLNACHMVYLTKEEADAKVLEREKKEINEEMYRMYGIEEVEV